MSKDKLKELEALPFEKALEKLEKIVEKMEDGELPLDDMIKNFEEATILSAICGKKLKAIEKKIEVSERCKLELSIRCRRTMGKPTKKDKTQCVEVRFRAILHDLLSSW